MTPPEPRPQPDAATADTPTGEKPTRLGGYHSGGVPGEEGDVRTRMRVLKVGDGSRINKSRPLKGGSGAEQASTARLDARRLSPAGSDASATAFVIAKKGAEVLDTPVFRAGESGGHEAVAVFTNREKAQKYLDRAGWNETDEVGELSADGLLRWLVEAARDGVWCATVDPDRDRHLAGHPQAVLLLDGLAEESADSLRRQVAELARV